MCLSEQVSDAPNALPYPRRLGQSADGGQSCPVSICYLSVCADSTQAEEIDLELRTLSAEPPLQFQGGEPTWSFPLSSWAYHQKLVQFRLILQMGFELSIYSPEELPGMYWYLSHICSTHLGEVAHTYYCGGCLCDRSTCVVRCTGPAQRAPVCLVSPGIFY